MRLHVWKGGLLQAGPVSLTLAPMLSCTLAGTCQLLCPPRSSPSQLGCGGAAVQCTSPYDHP